MNKILLIGNSGLKAKRLDGQTIKVRLYLRKIRDEGCYVDFVDLETFTKKPFSILRHIKKSIKTCNRIVLLSAERGCKVLIPFINFYNKKYKKPFILPLIGISVLHYSIDKLSDYEKKDFVINGNYTLCKFNNKVRNQLSKVTYVLPETELLSKIFREFYKIDNVISLNNFREGIITKNSIGSNSTELRIVFLSRVTGIKGIFDIMPIVRDLINQGYNLKLDIYGELLITKEEESLFNSFLSKGINYCGVINFEDVIETIRKYDLFVFPTRYTGEGTPGVLSESVIAGTPILTSDFLQARFLLKDGVNSIFYKMYDKEDLKNKLIQILKNKELLKTISVGTMELGKKFTYEYEREKFLKYVCGFDETKQ